MQCVTIRTPPGLVYIWRGRPPKCASTLNSSVVARHVEGHLRVMISIGERAALNNTYTSLTLTPRQMVLASHLHTDGSITHSTNVSRSRASLHCQMRQPRSATNTAAEKRHVHIETV